MYRILVAIDGSENARRAAHYAAARARDSGCKVDVLHVGKDVMAWEVGPLTSGDSVASLHEAESARVLDECARAFDASVRLERHVTYGDVATRILEEAHRLGADEIVVGSRGLGPLKAAVLGSVASRLVHESPVPVVVVR